MRKQIRPYHAMDPWYLDGKPELLVGESPHRLPNPVHSP